MITKIRLRVKGKFNVTKFYLAFDFAMLQIGIQAKLFASVFFNPRGNLSAVPLAGFALV